ncbi:host specificity protein J [Haemophilus paraphrohaemolyticus]|uniref:Host specificity protein J n=1 Tax=Haemophilus paraphrohaemolyticus TaxID=736 RepID=A0A369ZU64_9PAST|nr:phage tail protein [Haemophilus paraphrohaemolyticus]RDF11288.1 host specificity protein J [Haemophilus paraphrohaemolyticus]
MGLFRKKKKAHTPIEAKESGRSKQRIKIVEVLSEGEIEGLVDGLKSVYLDKTPIEAQDGSHYFKNMEIEGREGTQTQEVMQGFQAVEKEVSVSTEITQRTALTRTVTDANVNRLRLTLGVQALFEQNDQGDTNPVTIELNITVGTQQIPFTIHGKYNSPYSRSIEVTNLPAVPFTIKVERITADSTSNRLANKTMWASYTEIIDAQFRYPNTAYIGVKFDSEYFNNIPTRTYEIYGIKVRVPSNYNPETRTYTGLWDGTFKVAYTNNPAWILMDIVTHKRYGLGDRLGEFSVDKWALYQIAQYCDQMIPDGFGGQEPRFTCNLWLTEQRSAYDVLSDLCSIFRAIPVWNGTELTFIMDRPSDPVWAYTNANVIGGQFSRQYSAMKARHNAIQVEYKDAENNYESTIEYISDDEQIRKFGLNLKKVTAFGCTSRGQAFRTGKWILETERLETETITFTVGSEGLMNIPGDIIRVSDNHFAGTNIGGRVQAIHGRILTLDREIQFSANHFLSYINAQAKHQKIRITAVSGKQVTLESEPVGLSLQGVWSLLTQTVASQLYRCMTVTENEEGTYTIFALQHEPQKEAIVDNGASFEPRNTSVIKTPTLESLNAEATPNGLKLNWSSTAGVGTLTYDIKILKAGNLYAYHKGISSTEFSTDDLPDGDYTAIVIAKNASGQMVSEKSQSFTINRPPVPRDVAVLGGLGNITISWAWVDDFTQTEIWVSEQDNLTTAQRLTKLTAKMYSHEVGAKQVRYYWLRHVRGQNVGSFYQQTGLRGESSVDIDKELKLLNEKLSKNIVNEVIDTALPARNLDLIKTVNGLNTGEYQGHKQVYNTADGKLYTWNGSKYLENGIDINGVKIRTTQLVGTLQANQIGADTIGAGALQAGAVRADHLAAGEISADKLAIGLGGNLLTNPIFANNGYGWNTFFNNNATGIHTAHQRSDTWGNLSYLPNENIFTGSFNVSNASIANGARVGGVYINVPVVAGKWYMLSCYVGCHRGVIQISPEFRTANGGRVGIKYSKTSNANFAGGLKGAERIYVLAQAPDNAISVDFFISVYKTENTSNLAWFAQRPMLEECTEHTKVPSPWQNAGVTAIHGGSIVTNSITAQQIAANTITGNEIKSGTITAKEIASGTITGKHIAASQTLQSPIIRGGVLEVGSLIGGNLYEFLSISPNGRTASTVVIKPSIAERLLIIKWETGEVRYSNNSVSIMSNDEWVTKIESTHKKSSFYRKGLYTQTIPANTEVRITLNYFAKNIINPIDIETIVFSGKKYIEVR